MSGARYYLIESENPEKALEELRKNFDTSEDTGEIFDENRILIDRDERVPDPRNEPEKWANLSHVASRILKISWNDTSDVTYGELYEITQKSLNGIVHEHSHLFGYPGTSNKEDFVSPYQGYSYLPAYFYHKHDFKMFDKYPRQEEEIEYDNLYNPENNPDEEYFCPICKNNDIDSNWDIECENCGYKRSIPWFRGHDGLDPYLNFGPHDISQENSRYCIIEFSGREPLTTNGELCKIEEITLIGAIKRYYKDVYDPDTAEKLYCALLAYEKRRNPEELVEVKVNGESFSYESTLEGGSDKYEKYKIEIEDCSRKEINDLSKLSKLLNWINRKFLSK